MRHIRSAVLGAALVAGAASIAAAQQPAPRAPQRAEQGIKGERGEGRGMRAGQLGRQLFRGIALTDAEKAQIKTVRERYRDQFKALREANKPQIEAIRAARQKGDTAAARAIWAKNADQRAKAQSLLVQMQGDLRNALLPEHRAQFDQNVAKVKARMDQRVARFRQHRGHRVPKKGA